MKRKYISLVALVFTLSITACNNKAEEVKTEKEVVVEDEISDEEFEKEMQELDEDVEGMEEETTKEKTMESKMEDGKKVVEEKVTIKK